MIHLRGIRALALLAAFLIGLGFAPLFAQFSSGIEGTVKDNSGAVIPGAVVTITDTRLGVTKTATSNQAGFFSIGSIAASTYNVQITMKGFETYTQDGLSLQVGETRTIAPVLIVGSAATHVTVSAAAAALNLTTPTTGAVISQTTVDQTPLPGQNVYGLASLTPGITGTGVTSGDNYTNEYAININAAGLRQEENGYEIDGAFTDTPSRGGSSSISPMPEIVQSIDIRTNDFDAQKGRNGGANVDVFTKSGSNQVHGTVDYYFLNNDLSARTEFESTVPAFERNESGFTLGGPVIKNKLFLYGGLDVLRSSTTSAGAYTVETQDFDTYAETNLPNNLATQVLKTAPPLVFPTTGLKTVAQLEASTPGYYPAPAGIPADLNAVGTADISYSIPKNGYQYSIRGDDYIGNSDRIYGEFLRTYDTSEGTSPRSALNDNEQNSSDFGNADWTHTFSPKLLNEAGINIIRPYGSDLPVSTMAIPYINVTGLQGFSNWGPGNFTQTTVGWRDVMTATVKTHTLKFGFEQDNIRENASQTGAFDRPTYNFNNLLDFVQDKATSESATPVDLTTHQQTIYNRRYRTLYSGAYVQDDWKATPRLTVNLGVRYDVMANFFSINNPRLTNFTFGSGAGYDQQIANGVTGLTASNHVLDHNIWEVTPRFGFSYDVFGDGRTAIRGGVGMFADQPPYLHITDILAGNLPNIYTPSISVYQGSSTPTFQLCDPPSGFYEACPVVDTSNVVLNSSGGVVGQRASLGGYSPNYRLTQVDEWTLSVQHQLGNDLILEVNYSASSAHHLPVYNQDINRFAGDLVVNKNVLTRLNPNFGGIIYASSSGSSNGNYGSITVARRTSHGLTLRGIYTFGKALDEISTSGSLDSGSITNNANGGNQNGPVYQNGDLSAQYSRADYDIRQQFSADGTWLVPNHYAHALVRDVIGGWQFSGVWILQSGLPFTVYTSAAFNPVYNAAGQVVGNTGGDYNADGSNYDVPNVPSFGRKLSGQSKKNYLNGLFAASAFPVPTPGTEGDLGRNTYNQLGYNNLDFTFAKLFSTKWFSGERLHIEARAETFNLFNRVNLTSMTSDLSQSLFGHETNQLPARSIQLHVRASF